MVSCWVGNYSEGLLIWVLTDECAAAQVGTSLNVVIGGPAGWQYLVVVYTLPNR